MSDGDWHDPFEDEAARERARRRAEREQRRRERRRDLADRVREESEREAAREGGAGGSQPQAAGSQRGPAGAENGRAAAEPGSPRDEPGAAPVAPDPPSTGESTAAGGRPPTAETAAAPLPITGADDRDAADDREPGGEDPETGDHDPETGDHAPAPPRRSRPRRARRGSGGVIWRRRLGAVAVLGAGIALALFGVATMADRIGGGSGGEEASAPADARPVISVTIPEGLDRRQIAEIASEAGLRGNYARASRSANGFNPGRFGAEGPDSLEGFLFPATYELPEGARVGALIQRQLRAFREQIGQVGMSTAQERNLSVYDVLKIASMIEREVQIPEERKLVSAVIHNRLRAGNPLGIDATIRYEDGNFEEPLTQSRLEEPTPYNTRTNAGLPPTPIGNPGLATIRAAANPADTDHFYYVVKPNTCGEHFFTADEQEFLNAAAEYQSELEAQGGAPTPEDC